MTVLTGVREEPVVRPGTSRPAATTRRKLAHVPALDGLRGLAVAGVLLYHGGHLRGGYLGVDLFFVLSGYLITSLLLHEWGGSGRLALGHFWSRRARRLLPAVFLLLLGVAAYARWVAAPTELAQIRGDGLATLFYTANWHTIFRGTIYGDQFVRPSPLSHTWSLAIEEQYYLLWPLVLLGLFKIRRSPRVVQVFSAGLASLSVATMIVLHVTHRASDNSLYLGTHTRIAAIAMGAFVAAAQVRRRSTATSFNRPMAQILGGVALVGTIVAWATLDLGSSFLYSGGLAFCGVAVAVIIAAITAQPGGILARLLASPPLRGLGLISYGVYLWHIPVYLVLDGQRTGLHGWPLLAVQIFVSIDIAVLSYLLVEQPIRRGGLRPGTARLTAIAGAGLVVMALLVSTTGAVSAGGDLAKSKAPRGLRLAKDPNAPRLLVVGDSVGLALVDEGILPLRNELGASVASGANVGCSIMADVGPITDEVGKEIDPRLYKDCLTYYDQRLASIRPQIVLVLFGATLNFRVKIAGRARTACDGRFQQALGQRLDDVGVRMAKSGATVVLATTPELDRALAGLLGIHDISQRAACLNDVIRQAARDHPERFKLVDLAGFTCPSDGQCRNQVDGTTLRPDGLHFRGDGAKLTARWLVPRVLQAAHGGG